MRSDVDSLRGWAQPGHETPQSVARSLKRTMVALCASWTLSRQRLTGVLAAGQRWCRRRWCRRRLGLRTACGAAGDDFSRHEMSDEAACVVQVRGGLRACYTPGCSPL